MKTVLVIGANGMLGQDLVPTLSDRYTVIAAGRDRADLRDAAGLGALLAETTPDAVVNCAAITNVDGCESEPDEAYAVNGLGVRNLAVAASAVEAEVLHVSTDFVFDGEKGEPYLEYDMARPLSVYGASKLWGEQALRDHCARFRIVRTQWLYGHHGKNFVETILGRAREGHPLKVVDDQVGCPTSTMELSRAIARLLEAQGRFGIYHASGRGECSWHGLAKRALEIAGLGDAAIEPCSSSEFPRPAHRPADSRMRNYHMELDGGDPMLPWEEALEEYLAAAATA